jgi:uncharacterized membrane protein YdjX (TVP38/TMEM64 family)
MPPHAEISATDTAPRTRLIVRLLPLLALFLTGLALWWAGAADVLSLKQLAEHREMLRGFVAQHLVAALLTFMLLYVGVVALSLPVAAPLTVAGGFLFGCIAGSLAALVAATLGAVLIFLLARGTLAGSLSRMASGRLDRLRAGFQEDAFSYLLFLRLVPLFPFWLVNLAPALLGVPLRTFLLATLIGIIPGTFAFALTGAGLDSVLTAHYDAYLACLAKSPTHQGCSFDLAPAHLLTPTLLFAFVALGVVALIPPIVKRVWKRRRTPDGSELPGGEG